jgi:hypothetical protein
MIPTINGQGMGTYSTAQPECWFTQGKTSYNLGLGLLDQSGMMKPAKVDQFTRYNASLKISSELNKYVTIRAEHLFKKK